jgi:hypothetical protein
VSRLLRAAALGVLVALRGTALLADPLSATDILDRAAELDGNAVLLRGEAIGECIERGEHCWINVSDGTIAIGVWMRSGLAQRISFWGGPGVRGDIVEVAGVVRRADARQGGELDLEASDLRVAEAGFRIRAGVPSWKRTLATALACAAAVLLIGYYWRPWRAPRPPK